MKEIIVTGNYKVTIVYFALLGILGVLILTGYVYSYLYIEIHAGSFSVIVMGLLFAIGVTLYGFGLSKLPIPEIVISDEGIRSNNSTWNSTYKWEKIKKVELFKNKIEVVYAQTGLKNEIGIPYIIRLSSKNRHRLSNGLSDYCEKYNVVFSSK